MNSFLNKYFDAIYCINLDRRPDRWQEVVKEFKKYNIKVIRFSAIDGINKIVLPNQTISRSELACRDSHLALLQKMVALNHQRILIFEDDIFFTSNPHHHVKDVIENIPKNLGWHQIYLGANHIIPPTKLGEVWKCTKAFTTSSYGISRWYADYILSQAQANNNKQIDVMYAELHPISNSFCVFPSCVQQKAGFSDIQNKQMDYKC